MFICKKCGSTSKPKKYVGFWKSQRITEENAKTPIIPKYGFHLGITCRDCGAYNGFIKQDDSMLLVKFYEDETETNSTKKSLYEQSFT
jgi:ribosomal protein L40E